MADLEGRTIGKSFEELYPGDVVAAIAADFAGREVTVCQRFCRWHNSDDCPFRGVDKPSGGYCSEFTVKVNTPEKLDSLLCKLAADFGRPII